MSHQLCIFTASDTPEETPSSFYDIKETWGIGGSNSILRFTDDAVRVFATLETSREKCRFFDKAGQPMTEQEFREQFDFYSGESFEVIMKRDTGEFLIKPRGSRTKEIITYGGRQVKKFLGEKTA